MLGPSRVTEQFENTRHNIELTDITLKVKGSLEGGDKRGESLRRSLLKKPNYINTTNCSHTAVMNIIGSEQQSFRAALPDCSLPSAYPPHNCILQSVFVLFLVLQQSESFLFTKQCLRLKFSTDVLYIVMLYTDLSQCVLTGVLASISGFSGCGTE
ncbi:hypothetical protein J6590_057217 [Homalodisca vitripennis]|nr:hypothetical protein J6590_057217 [Homalodisca vitripennis]